jgi:transaldolase/glucose-6-phosphate isomerase
MSSVIKLNLLGQSVWYDNVERSLIKNGKMRAMIESRTIYGVTSNPSIFKNAILHTDAYNADIKTMSWVGLNPQEIFYRLAIKDIRDVADLFLPYYEATQGADGFVSLEVNPKLAYYTKGTIEEVKWLWRAVNRPNLMVKIPATKEGLPAISEAIASGINVNVTLIFSRQRYVEVMEAYVKGLEMGLERGIDVSGIASVASFFVSRLDTKADGYLEELIKEGGTTADRARALLGTIAVANTRLAYQAYEQFFGMNRFSLLEKQGACKQRPLWASTSTKNPDYADVKYIEELIAGNTVNTVPPKTLEAYLDHGDPKIRIYEDLDKAELIFDQLEGLGISIDRLTQELEDEGVAQFEGAFDDLLVSIADKQRDYMADLVSLSSKVQDEVNNFEENRVNSRIFRNDPTVWTDDLQGKSEIQKRLGWLYLPSESKSLFKDLALFVEDCKKDGIEQVLLLGMGGSSLAPETMYLVLKQQITGMDFKILDSTVPSEVKASEDWVDYQKTLFIVASKSGSTTETLSAFDYFWLQSEPELSEQRPRHFIAITDPGSSLAKLGQSLGFRAVFGANSNVGGRYSALSHFGLVPAALMGIDTGKLLEAAQAGFESAFCSDLDKNTSALLGIICGTAQTQGKDKLTILTDSSLSPLGAWLEQLIAESSGKQGKGIVPIVDEPEVAVEKYHFDRLFVYIRFSGEYDQFVKDLKSANHPVITLAYEDLYDIGRIFYDWEYAVAVACHVIGVNAFDQPNVQGSKDRTKQKISNYLEQGKLDEAVPVWQKDGLQVFGPPFDGLNDCHSLWDVINRFIESSVDGDYIAINAYVPRNADTTEKLTRLRKHILEKTGRGTTLGFGPRFQHSTGQLHKGGANNGLFIQITMDDAEDMEIPAKGYTFGVLARAQAQGDLESLLAKKRRAIRIHFQSKEIMDF